LGLNHCHLIDGDYLERCRNEMLILTKICKKPESSLSFRYENTVTDVTNLRPVKTVHRDEHVLSLAQSNKLFHELK